LKRKLGLDVGDKTIGVAVSDGLGITAQGLCTIKRDTPKADIAVLIDMINEWDVDVLVIGLPKNMNNTEGPQAEKVRAFTKQLMKKVNYSDKVKDNNVEAVLWDERLSTKLVERTLIAADVRRKDRKKVIDKLAAANILQGYMEKERIQKERT